MLEKSLTEDLANSDYRIRMRTIYALVEQKHAEAVPLLLTLLSDREMLVRCAAIVALGTFADRRAFEPLVAHLTATISLEREHAIRALVALGNPQYRDPFLQALKMETKPSIRMQLIRAVSVFREEVVFEALIELLTDRHENVRAVAAIALGGMGQPRAIPALQHMALTDNAESYIYDQEEPNSSIAQRAIQMLLHPEQAQDIDWPT